MLDNKGVSNALLIDLDGVMYQAGRVIDGAVDALDWLRQQQVPYLFVTNTTSRSRTDLLDRFETFGFDAKTDEIVTPIVAATQWLGSRQLYRAALFVTESAKHDFAGVEAVPLEGDAPVDAVVIGDLGEAWDYPLLNCAFRMLMHDPKPELIALGMTRYWQGPDGLRLDVAPFIKALEHAASCEATVIGKPAAAFFDASLALLDCDAGRALMIGDDIVGDIDGAQRCGIRGIQVKTGKFREPDLSGEIKPFAVLDSIADLPAWWSETLAR